MHINRKDNTPRNAKERRFYTFPRVFYVFPHVVYTYSTCSHTWEHVGTRSHTYGTCIPLEGTRNL